MIKNTGEADISKEYLRAEIFAKQNVPEYSSLTDSAKRAVKRTIVESRANGLKDEDLRVFAKFSAKSIIIKQQ